jgi:hypothetical protein
MEPAASCLPKDTCCPWYPTLDGVAASMAAATGFVIVAMVLALRARGLLDGDLL